MSGSLKRDEWETVRLGDVCDDKVEKLSSSSQGEIYYVDIASINNETKEIVSPQRIDSATAPSRAKQILKKNDVLVSTVRPNLNAVAIHEIDYDIPTIASTGFCVLRCHNSLDSHYTFYFCQSDYFIKSLVKVATGASYPAVRNSDVLGVKIPLPPLDVQRRIADTLDKVTELIDLRKKQLEKLDELVKARFVEMFGNPLDGTAKYPIHQVGEVAEAVDPQPSHRTPPIEEGGVPYVSIKDCDYKTGFIDFEGARKVSKTVLEEHLNRYILQDGDFIIGKIGTIGKPVFVPARNDYTLSANIVLVQPNSKLVSPCFLKYSFESDFVERQFTEAKNSTSQAAFGIQKVRAVEVMNPELDVQRDFERFVKQTNKAKVLIQQSLDTLETLKKSLMQEYFGQ